MKLADVQNNPYVANLYDKVTLTITFPKSEFRKVQEIADKIKSTTDFEIEIEKPRRSLDANGLFWHCVGEIAAHIGSDRWSVYLTLLKRYGKYTYVCVKPNAVDAVKRQWRETEEIGHITINGQDAVQLLCFFGSSTYDSKEFSRLLDGAISEMHELGIEVPGAEREEGIYRSWTEKFGK